MPLPTPVVRRLLAIVLALLCLGLLPAAAAAAPAVWLCQPGRAADPCSTSRTATVLSPAGAVRATERAPRRRTPIDCFYVYPTVSDQRTPLADLTVDPAQRAIARFQASRFSQHCRVWAPMYRQVTIAGLLNPASVPADGRDRGYADVRAAWREYLSRHNRGRGVVLIGHSQGTFVLRRLLAEEIETRPSVRRRLVSALLIGGNVTVRRGRDSGGDFKRVRACRSGAQLGCVVAYSVFNAPVPADSRFGRPAAADRAQLEVLCTNPAAIGGGSARLHGYVATEPFPGTIGALVDLQLGELPTVSTPWISYPDSYRARCSSAGGASVLQVTSVGGGRVLKPAPDATWGLHLSDMNIAMGDLVELVRRQSAAYGRR